MDAGIDSVVFDCEVNLLFKPNINLLMRSTTTLAIKDSQKANAFKLQISQLLQSFIKLGNITKSNYSLVMR